MRKKSCPKSGAVAKVREVYNELRHRPLEPEQIRELKEVFRKRDKGSAKRAPKRIAKPEQDTGLA